jgi:hypothetical protein
MIDLAVRLGDKIGVYMRIDMFVWDNKVYVQEYTSNHMNGLRHCAAKITDEGCIDSCFLGRMWNDAGAPYGGHATDVPNKLDGFDTLTPKEQCDLLKSLPPTTYVSSCSNVT